MRFYLFAFLVLLQLVVPAQQTQVLDSIYGVLENAVDTARVERLNDFFIAKHKQGAIKSDALLREALVLSHELNYTQGMARTLENLGAYYYFLGNYQKASKFSKMAATLYEKLSLDEYWAGVLFNYAMAAYEMGNYESATNAALAVNRWFENEKQLEGLSKALNLLGLLYIDQKQADQAEPYFRRSLKIYTEQKDTIGIAGALNNMAIIHNIKGEQEKALALYDEALSLSEQIGHNSGIISASNNIGTIQRGLGKYQEALRSHKKALKLAKSSKSTRKIANSLYYLGQLYAIQQQYKLAIDYFKKSLKVAHAGGVKRTILLNYRELAQAYEESGSLPKAYEYFKKYHNLGDSLLSEEKSKHLNEIIVKYEAEKKERELREKEVLNLTLAKENADIKLQNYRVRIGIFIAAALVLTLFVLMIRIQKRKLRFYEDEFRKLRQLRMKQQLERMEEEIDPQWLKESKQKEAETIAISMREKIQLIKLSEIAFFTAEDKYVFLHQLNGDRHITEYTLTEIQEKWPQVFLRIHRSYLVNRQHVKKCFKGSRDKFIIVLADRKNTRITSGRTYATALEEYQT